MKTNKNKLHIVIERNGRKLFEKDTEDFMLSTDTEFLTTNDLDDSRTVISGIIRELLLKFGLDSEEQTEEEFYSDPLNKIRLKRILIEYLFDIQKYVEECFDLKFAKENLKKNDIYIDYEAIFKDFLDNLLNGNENNE